MSHNTHDHSAENKTIMPFKSSFWLVIIIVGLFIAALNFIKVEGSDEGEAKGEQTEKAENKAIAAPEEKSSEQAKSIQPVESAADSATKAAQH